MPQVHLDNFVPQLVWLAVFFAILYFGIVRLTLPKIGGLVDRREASVKGDIATAETAKAESDRIHEAYQASLAAAHSEAQGAVGAAKASAAKATEARLAEANAAVAAHLAEAQASLDAARGGAMAEVERIAAFHEWAFDRDDQDEISISVKGSFAEYHIAFTWLSDIEALQVSGRRPDATAALDAVRRTGVTA